MKARESASALELGKYNQFREDYLLDVKNETRLHTMQLMYTIDGYDRCRHWELPSLPSNQRQFDHPNSTMTYAEVRDTRMMVIGWSMR